jgi:MFS family permease
MLTRLDFHASNEWRKIISSLSTGSPALFSTRFRAMQHRNFQLFIAGQLISLIGTWMQNTAQQWLVYRLTHSAVLLGVFGFASQVPMLFLSSLGGYLGDHYNRHRGVIATQMASMVLAFVLAALMLSGNIQGWHGAWVVIAIAFMLGAVNAFDVPIRQAFLVQMVGKEDLPNAIALNSSIFNGARVVGPAIGALTVAWVGEGWCFFLNGVSFIAVIVALVMMKIERMQVKPAKESPLKSLMQGFHFAMSDFPVRSTLLLLSVLSLFGLQYSVFMPIYAKDILRGDIRIQGYLMSAAGVGAVLGALHFAARTNYKGLARWIAATSTTCAVGLLIFSEAKVFWLCALVLLVVGFAATSQMAATNTLIQNRVPDELRSRVMAVYATMFMGVQPIGALIAGGVAKRIGAPHTLTVFGSLVLLGSLVFLSRVATKLPRTSEAKKAAADD